LRPALVDSSAWVDFLSGEKAAVGLVGPLLGRGLAAICGPVAAEVLSGAQNSSEFGVLRDLMDGLPQALDPIDLWPRVADHRFALARGGFRVGLIDIVIAVTALDAGLRLVTRDRDFERIRTVVPIDLDLF
jgi:predicted nucleic acid-binding protein